MVLCCVDVVDPARPSSWQPEASVLLFGGRRSPFARKAHAAIPEVALCRHAPGIDACA